MSLPSAHSNPSVAKLSGLYPTTRASSNSNNAISLPSYKEFDVKKASYSKTLISSLTELPPYSSDPRWLSNFDNIDEEKRLNELMLGDACHFILDKAKGVLANRRARDWSELRSKAGRKRRSDKITQYYVTIASLMTLLCRESSPLDLHHVTVTLDPGETVAEVMRNVRHELKRKTAGAGRFYWAGVQMAEAIVVRDFVQKTIQRHAHVLIGGFQAGTDIHKAINTIIENRNKRRRKKYNKPTLNDTRMDLVWSSNPKRLLSYHVNRDNLLVRGNAGSVVADQTVRALATHFLQGGFDGLEKAFADLPR